ncbi:MAG: hypothetical protein C5B50_28970 [Verrucomicrobia bacterium]|nr:MAG: hypothetical protein C5B50_28970 [Verrucomicrobiota bacterium]
MTVFQHCEQTVRKLRTRKKGPFSLPIFAAFLLLSSTCIAPAQTPSFLWAHIAGGATNDQAQAVARDLSGNIIVSGFFMGTCSIGTTNLVSAGLEDIFIAKYDAAGNFLWARQAGGTGYDEGRGVAVDSSGNIYVAGLFQNSASFGATVLASSGGNDIFIAKYDPSGNLVWAKAAGGTADDEAHGVAVDAAGNAYITGFADSRTATFGSLSFVNHSGFDNAFVAKCNNAGTFLWVRQISSTADSRGNGIALDGATNVFSAGSFAGTATFGSTNLAAAGTSGYPDVFLLKHDLSGNQLWVRQAGGTNDDEANGVAADAAGNTFVTGEFLGPATFSNTNLPGNGTKQIFVARYDAAGNLLWVRAAGGNNLIYGNAGLAVANDTNGNAFVTGFFSGNGLFGTNIVASAGFDDLFCSKYDSAGNVLWVRSAGGQDLDLSYGIAADWAGNAYLAGWFASSTVTFDNFTLTNTSARDVFLVKLGLAPPPTIKAALVNHQLVLTWPAYAGGFGLESAAAFPSPTWVTNPATPALIGTNCVLTLPSSDPARFFRLRK